MGRKPAKDAIQMKEENTLNATAIAALIDFAATFEQGTSTTDDAIINGDRMETLTVHFGVELGRGGFGKVCEGHIFDGVQGKIVTVAIKLFDISG